jgi:hypothetical protein
MRQEERDDADDAAEAVDDALDENPWLERMSQLGWLARGVVYTLMGLTAVQIAVADTGDDEASPTGSIGRIADAPGGRVLLFVLAVGLILFSAWRLLALALIRGHDLDAWARRVGYGASGSVTIVLAWTSAAAAFRDDDPDGSNSVENMSTTLLGWPLGRWILAAVGLATVAVGVYFVVDNAVRRSFVDDLDGVSDNSAATCDRHTALVIIGFIGWAGRGVVTIMVGIFITSAAIRFDPDDARGFDRSLREVASTDVGMAIVTLCAASLIAYGLFCLASHRYRTLDDDS